MKKLIVLLVSYVAPGLGAALYGPLISDVANKPCIVLAQSSTTPIKLTVVDITLCGVVENSIIYTGGAINTGATNNRSPIRLHLVSSADTIGFCRVAKNVGTAGNVANQFDLYACDGTTPVAFNETGPASSTWSHGGWVARMSLYQSRPGPILWMDGDGSGGTGGGVITAGMQSAATGTGWYDPARVWRVGLDLAIAGQVSYPFTAYSADLFGGVALTQAIKFYGDKAANTVNKTNAINTMMNSLPLPSAGCSVAEINCGFGQSTYMDYNHEPGASLYLQTFTMMKPFLTPTQIATWIANIIDGFPWNKGGYNYTGVTRTIPPLTPNTVGCNITTTTGLTVTGVGTCNWLSTVNPATQLINIADNILQPGVSGQTAFYQAIASVDSNNQLTLAFPLHGESTGRTNDNRYFFAPKWVQGTHIGWVDWGFNTFFNTSCGADFIHDSLTCPDHYTNGSLGCCFDPDNNHTLTRPLRNMEAGLAGADDDPRMRILFTENAMNWYHFMRPLAQRYGGITAQSTGYIDGRIWRDMTGFYGILKGSLVGDPDFTNGDPSIYRAAANWALGQVAPLSFPPDWNVTFGTAGEAGFARAGGELFWPGLSSILYRPDLPESQMMDYYFHNIYPQGNNASYLQGGGHGGIVPYYIYDRPDAPKLVPKLSIDLAVFGTQTTSTTPAASYTNEQRFGFTTRSSHAYNNRDSFQLFCDFSSSVGRDHGGFDWPHCDLQNGQAAGVGGLAITNGANNPWPYFASKDKPWNVSAMMLGGQSSLDLNNGGRNLMNRKHITETTAMLSASIRESLAISPKAITAYTTASHIRGGGGYGYLIRRYEMTNASPIVLSFYNHYNTAGNTPNTNTALTVTAGTPSTVALVSSTYNVQYYANVYGCTPTTQDGNLAHGDFTGSEGAFSRYEFKAPSGTSATCWEVIKFGNNGITAMPTVVSSVSGSHQVFEMQDTATPKLYFSAPAGVSNLTTCSATTTWSGTGQAVCEGLAPGTGYSITVNGSGVSGCTNQTITATDNLFDCPTGVPAGVVVISQSAPPVTNIGYRLLRGIASLRGSWW